MKLICDVKGCQKDIDVETIIHHHAKDGLCNPYDAKKHCYFELCKRHYKQLHKDGEDKLILKDEVYENRW